MDPLPPTVGLVLHFRRVDHTTACLESLLADGVEQAVLVDNSEDGGYSLTRLRPGVETLRERGMRIVELEPGRNLGFSAGVNAGLREITKRFGNAAVLLINNDARLVAGSHSILRHTLEEGAAIAIAQMRTANARVIDRIYYHRATGLLLRNPVAGSYAYYSGCCLMIGPALAQPPLFDEDFFFYGEDTELGWRLEQQGQPVRMGEGAAVEHEVSVGSRNGSLFYEYHMVRAHWLLAGKLADGRIQHVLFVLGRAITLPARALSRAARQRSILPLHGLVLATADVTRGRYQALTPPSCESGSNRRK